MTKTSLILLAFLGFATAACNTVEGVGRDVESAGQGIEGAASDDEDEDRGY